jgi:hypothetical protein
MVYFYYFEHYDKIPVKFFNLCVMHGYTFKEALAISHRLNRNREKMERKFWLRNLLKNNTNG